MRLSAGRGGQAAGLLLLLALAALLRARYPIGFGLLDDHYYGWASKVVLDHGLGGLPLTFGSNHRIGLWIPISTSFRAFGIHDASFVLFPWLGSLLLVAVVFLLGRRLFGPAAGLFAAGAQAVSSFDVAFASTMTIDLPTSCLVAASLLLFLEAERAPRARSLALHGLAAFCVLWAYFIKLTAPAIVAVHAAYTLLHRRSFRRHAAFYGWTLLLFSASFAVDAYRTGDPLHYLHSELASAPAPAPFSQLGALYPLWMFLPDPARGLRLFGPHFVVGAAATAACLAIPSLRRASALPLVWLASQLLFLQFFPAALEPPYRVMPRFFRYAHAFVAPVSLLIGACLAELFRALVRWRARAPGPARFAGAALGLALLAYALGSGAQGFRIGRLYREHQQDERFAARLLASLPPRPIYSDHDFYHRFHFETDYERISDAGWSLDGDLDMQQDVVGKRDLGPLRELESSYVVFGGSRGVDLDPRWILVRGDFQPPAHWSLVAQYDQPLDDFRPEVLRVYAVEPAPGRTRGPLDGE